MAQTFGTVLGYVSKITQGSQSYVARKVTGETLGFYSSVGEAKRAFMQFVSSNKLVTWTREDMHGAIESYTATLGH